MTSFTHSLFTPWCAATPSDLLSLLCFLCRSNLMGTKFTVYDSGLNPMKSTTSLEASNLRQELAAICYVSWSKCSWTHKLYLVFHTFQEICWAMSSDNKFRSQGFAIIGLRSSYHLCLNLHCRHRYCPQKHTIWCSYQWMNMLTWMFIIFST